MRKTVDHTNGVLCKDCKHCGEVLPGDYAQCSAPVPVWAGKLSGIVPTDRKVQCKVFSKKEF